MSFQKLKGKDLIVIAIFTVLILAMDMIVGMSLMALGIFVAMIISVGVGCLINMSIYMLMAARVKKPGVITLHALLRGILYTVMSTPLMLVIAIVPAIIAELVISIPKKNASLGYNALAFGIFNVVYSIHGSLIVLLMGKERFAEYGPQMFSAENLNIILDSAFNGGLLFGTMAFTALMCSIGYFIGRRLLKRNFEKAGVI